MACSAAWKRPRSPCCSWLFVGEGCAAGGAAGGAHEYGEREKERVEDEEKGMGVSVGFQCEGRGVSVY